MAMSAIQNTQILKNITNKKPFMRTIISKKTSTSIPQNIEAVLLESNFNEETIISIPKSATSVADMIGPPHPISNLRPIVWYRSTTETPLQRKLKNLQEATQAWNQRFWETHNNNFVKERQMFVENNLPVERQTLTADEMSSFYKDFLDKNWKNHVSYNFQWYRKNFTILFLAIIVTIERLFQRS